MWALVACDDGDDAGQPPSPDAGMGAGEGEGEGEAVTVEGTTSRVRTLDWLVSC